MQLVFNWHITEKCNYSCHYCFSKWENNREIWHDEKTSKKLIYEIASYNHALRFPMFTSATRLNFAGGEPLLAGAKLIGYVRFAKEKGIETSLITNGFLLTKNIEVVDSLDMLGISIDSFDKDTNFRI